MSDHRHSARDDPPTENHRVLVCFDDGMMTVGIMRHGYWLADWNRQNEIVWWMELPGPAAPDLLAACELALDALRERPLCTTITNTMAYEALVAAIAKAKGIS